MQRRFSATTRRFKKQQNSNAHTTCRRVNCSQSRKHAYLQPSNGENGVSGVLVSRKTGNSPIIHCPMKQKKRRKKSKPTSNNYVIQTDNNIIGPGWVPVTLESSADNVKRMHGGDGGESSNGAGCCVFPLPLLCTWLGRRHSKFYVFLFRLPVPKFAFWRFRHFWAGTFTGCMSA